MRPTDEYLQGLAEQIDAEAERVEEWNRDPNCSLAEYCQSFGYGEGEPELRSLSDDLAEKITELKRLLKPAAFRRVLSEVSSVDLVGMHTTDDEVFSVGIGEVEEQMDDALAGQIKALSGNDLERLRRMTRNCTVGYTCPDCIYVSMDYERWVLRVDGDALDRRLDGIKRTAIKRKPVEPRVTPAQRRAQFKLIRGAA